MLVNQSQPPGIQRDRLGGEQPVGPGQFVNRELAVAAAGGEALAVRVWETPVAFGGYRARC